MARSFLSKRLSNSPKCGGSACLNCEKCRLCIGCSVLRNHPNLNKDVKFNYPFFEVFDVEKWDFKPFILAKPDDSMCCK